VADTPIKRCVIYTRKSSEEGLEQNYNSLHAQREACEAYVRSQAGEGWRLIKTAYDDGGFSGGSMERPALQRLLEDIRRNQIDVVVVYRRPEWFFGLSNPTATSRGSPSLMARCGMAPGKVTRAICGESILKRERFWSGWRCRLEPWYRD
jgi:hypothetical protein